MNCPLLCQCVKFNTAVYVWGFSVWIQYLTTLYFINMCWFTNLEWIHVWPNYDFSVVVLGFITNYYFYSNYNRLVVGVEGNLLTLSISAGVNMISNCGCMFSAAKYSLWNHILISTSNIYPTNLIFFCSRHTTFTCLHIYLFYTKFQIPLHLLWCTSFDNVIWPKKIPKLCWTSAIVWRTVKAWFSITWK